MPLTAKPLTACLAAAMLLGACSGEDERTQAPAQDAAGTAPPTVLLGVWGIDCEQPDIRLEPEAIHVFAEGATYPLTGARSADGTLVLSYAGANGPVEETYAVEGETLALVEGVYDVGPITWNRPPMQRCDAA